jgi:hypothetical protein
LGAGGSHLIRGIIAAGLAALSLLVAATQATSRNFDRSATGLRFRFGSFHCRIDEIACLIFGLRSVKIFFGLHRAYRGFRSFDYALGRRRSRSVTPCRAVHFHDRRGRMPRAEKPAFTSRAQRDDTKP